MHTDWRDAVQPGDYFVCNAAWLIDDYTAENGGTLVIPGSHRRGELPSEALADCLADHPSQISLSGRAGSVVVFKRLFVRSYSLGGTTELWNMHLGWLKVVI